MAKIEVKEVRATMTQTDMEPPWEAVVSYGGRIEVVIPLPAVYLITDDRSQTLRESLEAMESLARELLDFADRTRKQFPNDFD